MSIQGGWMMLPLILLALFIYYTALDLYFWFTRLPILKANADEVDQWTETPATAPPAFGELIGYGRAGVHSDRDVQDRFEEVRQTYLPRIDRRICMLVHLIAAAPLSGLLGTVTGMLTTFRGLSISTGGQTIDLVAGGISEALITTQTGLLISIPAYVFVFLIQRQRNQLERTLCHLETASVQWHHQHNPPRRAA